MGKGTAESMLRKCDKTGETYSVALNFIQTYIYVETVILWVVSYTM
jgi:hypothetical protein